MANSVWSDVNGLDWKKIFTVALSRGGDLAELYFEDRQSLRMVYEDQKLDRTLHGRDRGVGMRILFNGRMVYGYTTSLTQDSLNQLATQLSSSVDSNKAGSVETNFHEPEATREIRAYRVKKNPFEVKISEKLKLLERADQAARTALPETKQVTVMLLNTSKHFMILNSEGVRTEDSKVYTHFVVSLVGEKNGRTEQSHESDGGYVGHEFFETRTPEDFAKEAARRVAIQLSALPAPSGALPVILSSEAGGTMIHEAVGHGLEADLACEGLSVYQNQIGQQVASPLITVIDDGTMPEKRGSFAYDDEGTPSQKTVLIENGILKNYMVDRICALKFDLQPTGNGRRETFRHRPMVRMTNTYIAPGKENPDAILKDTKYGVYVRSMGGGQVNTVTGDFVFAVDEAYLIRDGKLAEPIRGATLVGNGPAVMKSVDRVGSDLGFSTGTCGKDGQGAPVTDAQPTLRIPSLTVGGEVEISHYFPAV